MESGVSPLLRPYLSLLFILSADILESVGMEELTEMVQDVNKNEVSDKEQLSDRAYILDI